MGMEGVQKSQNADDIIYGSPLKPYRRLIQETGDIGVVAVFRGVLHDGPSQ